MGGSAFGNWEACSPCRKIFLEGWELYTHLPTSPFPRAGDRPHANALTTIMPKAKKVLHGGNRSQPYPRAGAPAAAAKAAAAATVPKEKGYKGGDHADKTEWKLRTAICCGTSL